MIHRALGLVAGLLAVVPMGLVLPASPEKEILELVVKDIRASQAPTVRMASGEQAVPELWLDTSRACFKDEEVCSQRKTYKTEQALFAELLSARRHGIDASVVAEEQRVSFGATIVEITPVDAVVRVKRSRRTNRPESSLSQYKLVKTERGWAIESKQMIASS